MNKLSVIIGRFQTPYLHQGHIKLIEEAKKVSDDVLILIGCTAAQGTDKNPLDFKTRESLFYSSGVLSNPAVLPLDDCPSDKDWSNKIDLIIEDLGFKEAIIFGGRDNSIEDYYCGKHTVAIIHQHGNHSSTSLRKEIAEEPMQCPNFRSGIIYHAENRYPIVYHTVDVVIRYKDKVLMGMKGDKFHFIGGFVDPKDEDLEAAAYRELFEETGIEDGVDLGLHSSMKIDDSRYRDTKDSIMTHIFITRTNNEEIDLQLQKIKDHEFKEFDYIELNETSLKYLVADCHKPIFTKIINFKHKCL